MEEGRGGRRFVERQCLVCVCEREREIEREGERGKERED